MPEVSPIYFKSFPNIRAFLWLIKKIEKHGKIDQLLLTGRRQAAIKDVKNVKHLFLYLEHVLKIALGKLAKLRAPTQ